ncbi:MAG: preprotein translocase subunit SecG [Limisphaerales bacterium]
MSLLIGFLTFILVLNCLLLILLVLVQLPKKEAGAGLAFGAGAVDTLIGAGSGNALTKMTKYAAGIFLGLGLVLAMLNAQRHSGTSGIQRELARKAAATPVLPTAPVTAPSAGPLNTNFSVPAASGAQSTSGPVLAIPQNNQTPAANNTPQAQPQP